VSDTADSLLTAGLGHFARGDDAAAVACWEEVLQQEPHHPRAAAYLTYARGIAPAGPVVSLPAPVVDTLPPTASSSPVEQVSFTPPPTAAPVTPPPAVDLSSSATLGRLPAVEPPTVTADTADWFQEASVATGSHPLNPGPEPTAPAVAAPVAAAEPDPLLAQVLQEMSAAAQAPPATPPMNVTARGGAMFGAAPPTAPASADGPWEAVMSPAPVGEPPRGAEVTNLDTPAQQVDANADGLQGMWAAPPTPAANADAAVMSPWDEGPTVSSQIVVVDSEGPKTQRAAPSRGSPNTPAPGKNAPGPMGNEQDLKTRCATMMARVRELHELGDFSGSQELVEKVLELDRANVEARDYMEKNEETLLKMYLSKLGTLEGIPRMLMSPDQIIWLNLHHKAGFLLSRVDGMSTFEDIMSLSAMPRLETVRLLAQLMAAGVIAAT
jgi:hypothetical protein